MTWPEKRFQVNDNFNVFLDKHSLKMGFDINDVDSSVTNMWGSPGMYYFSTDDPSIPPLSTRIPPGSDGTPRPPVMNTAT